MARQNRFFVPGCPQHVIQRGNNRQAVFFTLGDFGFYRDCLREAFQRQGCALHAYVLMTNHVHLLATPATPDSLPRAMQSLGRTDSLVQPHELYLALGRSPVERHRHPQRLADGERRISIEGGAGQWPAGAAVAAGTSSAQLIRL